MFVSHKEFTFDLIGSSHGPILVLSYLSSGTVLVNIKREGSIIKLIQVPIHWMVADDFNHLYSSLINMGCVGGYADELCGDMINFLFDFFVCI